MSRIKYIVFFLALCCVNMVQAQGPQVSIDIGRNKIKVTRLTAVTVTVSNLSEEDFEEGIQLVVSLRITNPSVAAWQIDTEKWIKGMTHPRMTIPVTRNRLTPDGSFVKILHVFGLRPGLYSVEAELEYHVLD